MKKTQKYTAIFLLNFFMSLIYWFWQLVVNLVIGLNDFTYSSKEAYIYEPAEVYYMLYLLLFIYIVVVVLINVCILNGWIRKKYEVDIMKCAVLAILGFNILFIMWFTRYILAVCFNIY